MGINGNEAHHQSSTNQRAKSDDSSHQEIDFPSTQARWGNSSRYVYASYNLVIHIQTCITHTICIHI